MHRTAFFPGGSFGKAFGLTLGAALAAACSDIDYEIKTPSDFGVLPDIQQGNFRAGNVEGLDYVSGDERGVTDASGAFTCATDEPVVFSIGSFVLGEMPCSTLAHPVSLSASGTLLDTGALNLARLLLILDEDADASNGIRVSAGLRSVADSWQPVDFTASDFAAELTQIVSDIASVDSRVVAELPSAAQAFAMLDASLACAYSGVYVNVVPSEPFGATINVSLIVRRDQDTAADTADFLLTRLAAQTQVIKVATPVVELMALPAFEGGGVDGAFFTPDQLSGQYVNAFAQREVDVNGSFGAQRIGSRLGEYRITGDIDLLADGEVLAPVRFRVALSLDGDSFAGEAFDVVTGGTHAVNGSRIGATDEFEFEVEARPGTASAMLIRDVSGEPVRLEGNWPGVEDNLFTATVCRLD